VKIPRKVHEKKNERILLQNSFYLENAPADLEAELDFPMGCRDIYGWILATDFEVFSIHMSHR
jgi:hypothetical protein